MLGFMFFVFFIMISLLSFLLGVVFFIKSLSLLIEFSLFNISSVSYSMILYVDWMSLIFMSFVFLISSSVILYSLEYMHKEKFLSRFIFLVVLFVFSMMMVILSPNLLSILLGWDGLGLVSYCLVIYFQNEKSFNSGMLTILSNRLGDVAILISIVWLLNFGSWNYYFYFNIFSGYEEIKLVFFLVLLAAFTKSAQIPFSSWLPAAMAAPTPVSSLVHSSTLVTAGVYLMLRFLDGLSFNFLMIILYVALMTMFMAGLGANFEFDLKKIIALSTLSQLGLMFCSFCLMDVNLIFFHLLTHALFKALLFMCAGLIIHSFSDCQDIRYMGGLINYIPLTSSYFLICSVALCGIPFFSGFYSKDLIVEVYSMDHVNLYIYWVFLLSIGLTVSYSVRLVLYMMGDSLHYFSLNLIFEEWGAMLYGMSILILSVVFMGSVLTWLIFDPYFIFLPFMIKLNTLVFIMVGAFLGYFFYDYEYFYISKSKMLLSWSSFAGLMWYLPILSTSFISRVPNSFSLNFYKTFDQGWFEYYGSWGIMRVLFLIINIVQLFSKNLINYFLGLIILGFMFFMFL
nr:NADH dehydrogenase subunit 5 [Octodonta nipae]